MKRHNVFILCILVTFLMILAGCQAINVDADELERPIFSVASGTRFDDVIVNFEITDPNEGVGAVVYYTLNGDDPIQEETASCFLYTGTFNIETSCTVKARAYKNSYNPSTIAYANYIEAFELMAPMIEERSQFGIVNVAGEVYLIGGLDSSGAPTDTVYKYTINTDTWETTDYFLPCNLCNFGTAAVGSTIYIFGGHDGISYQNSIYKLNLTEEPPAWSPLTTELPTARMFLSAVQINNLIYLIGGQENSSDFLADIDVFDPSDNSINTPSNPNDLPYPRSRMTAVTNGSIIYTIAGLNAGGYTSYTETFTPPAPGTVDSAFSDITSTLSQSSGIFYNNKIYCIGGENTGDLLDDIFIYDFSIPAWVTDECPVPSKLKGAGAIVHNSEIFLFGGSTDTDTAAESSSVYKYHFE
ncbi:MAG: chitobiase/beta-hexosaminidase C-terminal domain-containing protein [Spirochaetales bacterium]|nr:chitobiase/beta-hexosaminidase C-terminal domain-containing protein [Spirochaetales bacterium]